MSSRTKRSPSTTYSETKLRVISQRNRSCYALICHPSDKMVGGGGGEDSLISPGRHGGGDVAFGKVGARHQSRGNGRSSAGLGNISKLQLPRLVFVAIGRRTIGGNFLRAGHGGIRISSGRAVEAKIGLVQWAHHLGVEHATVEHLVETLHLVPLQILAGTHAGVDQPRFPIGLEDQTSF